MRLPSAVARGAEGILLAVGLGAAITAQVTPGADKQPLEKVSLEGDIRSGPVSDAGHGGQFDGTILDGVTVFVALQREEGLSLTVESDHSRVRLAGGTPGNAGAILVNPREPESRDVRLADDSAVIAGTFGMDGSFVVDLPELGEEIFVQGMEFTPLGGAYSGIRRIAPPGEGLEEEPELTWDEQAISDAVERTTRGLGRELVSLRFHGAARLGGLDGFVDVTVFLGREILEGKDSYSLYLGPALARRTAVVDLDDHDGAKFTYRRAQDLAGAVEAVILLDAFADDGELRDARGRIGLFRKYLARRYSGPIGAAGTVVAVPRDEPDHGSEQLQVGWELLGQLSAPRRAGDKQPFPERRSRDHAGRYTGTLGDAGSIAAPLPEPEQELVAGWEVTPLTGQPRRAGDRHPIPLRKAHDHAGRYTGPLGDAGSRMLELESAARTLELLRTKLMMHRI